MNDNINIDSLFSFQGEKKLMPKFTPEASDEMGFTDPDKFLKKAKGLVVEQYNKMLPSAEFIAEEEDISYIQASYRRDALKITQKDLFVVWWSKTLQNWKAVVATNLPDDALYFEITYNGDKKEAYVDIYDKIKNVAVPDVSA